MTAPEDNVPGEPDDLRRVLRAAEAASPLDALDAVAEGLASAIGARELSFLIADLGGRALVRLTHVAIEPHGQRPAAGTRRQHRDLATALPFDGGLQEAALRTQQQQVTAEGTGWRVITPVTQRGDAIGVLEMVLSAEPDPQDLEQFASAARVFALIVIANWRHTDLFEWGQRGTPLTLSAEIQRRLLPSAFTCEAGAFTIAGWLEPAASVGGDTFDYTVERERLHLSLTDAMGHGVRSALTATLCVASLRNTRRTGASLREQAWSANETLLTEGVGGDSFVTGLLGRLNLHTGVLALVNAGHVVPLLVRDGDVSAVALPIDLPFGIFAGQDYQSTDVPLRPGDRLMLLTDGIVERHGSALDLYSELLRSRSLHPREAVRAVADAVLALAGGSLADDATLLVLDWHGGGRPGSAP